MTFAMCMKEIYACSVYIGSVIHVTIMTSHMEIYLTAMNRLDMYI